MSPTWREEIDYERELNNYEMEEDSYLSSRLAFGLVLGGFALTILLVITSVALAVIFAQPGILGFLTVPVFTVVPCLVFLPDTYRDYRRDKRDLARAKRRLEQAEVKRVQRIVDEYEKGKK